MAELHMIDSPLVQQFLGELRRKEWDHWKIVHIAQKLGPIYAHEISKDLPTWQYKITTSMGETTDVTAPEKPVIVPVLRAGDIPGLEIYKSFLEAMFGPVALSRDEKLLIPIEQYSKIPKVKGKKVIGVEPMIATGGSAAHLVNMVMSRGASGVYLASMVSAPQGLEKVMETPGLEHLYLLAQDAGLNDKGYIVGPGFGDAGQKFSNTTF